MCVNSLFRFCTNSILSILFVASRQMKAYMRVWCIPSICAYISLLSQFAGYTKFIRMRSKQMLWEEGARGTVLFSRVIHHRPYCLASDKCELSPEWPFARAFDQTKRNALEKKIFFIHVNLAGRDQVSQNQPDHIADSEATGLMWIQKFSEAGPQIDEKSGFGYKCYSLNHHRIYLTQSFALTNLAFCEKKFYSISMLFLFVERCMAVGSQ